MTGSVSDWMLLARAVKRLELDSLQRTKGFRNPAGIERKYFCTSVQDARIYARLAQARFDDGPYTIVVTAIRANLLSRTSKVRVDGGILAVTIPTALLYALQPPRMIGDG